MTKSIQSDPSNSGDSPAFHSPPEAMIRQALSLAGVLAVRLVGPPGSGKTELIEATMKRSTAPRRVAVIVINPASSRDAARLRPHGGPVETIDASIPRAAAVWRVIQQLPLQEIDLLLIETCGGLSHMEDIGQDTTVAAFAVSGGDDKAAEYHQLLVNSSLVLLTQTDMLSMVRFNRHVFRGDVHNANSNVEIMDVAAVTGTGIHPWLQWLQNAQAEKKRRTAPEIFEDLSAEPFFG